MLNIGFLNFLYLNATRSYIDDGILKFDFDNCHDWPEVVEHLNSISKGLRYLFSVTTDFDLIVSIGIKELLLNYPKRCNYGKS